MLDLGDALIRRRVFHSVLVTSTPLWNVTPWMTLDNRFSPFNRRQDFAAAITSLKTGHQRAARGNERGGGDCPAAVGDWSPLIHRDKDRDHSHTIIAGVLPWCKNHGF